MSPTLVNVGPVCSRSPAASRQVPESARSSDKRQSQPASRPRSHVPASTRPPASSVTPSMPSVAAASSHRSSRPSAARSVGRTKCQVLVCGPPRAGFGRQGDTFIANCRVSSTNSGSFWRNLCFSVKCRNDKVHNCSDLVRFGRAAGHVIVNIHYLVQCLEHRVECRDGYHPFWHGVTTLGRILSGLSVEMVVNAVSTMSFMD